VRRQRGSVYRQHGFIGGGGRYGLWPFKDATPASDIEGAMKKPGSVVVEVLSVLFVLGLVIAIVVPDGHGRVATVPHRATITRLETVRSALFRYWADHGATYPALHDLDALRDEPRTGRSRSGLGAYLERIPDNPNTEGNRIGSITDPLGASDWVYDADSGVFKANDSEATRAL